MSERVELFTSSKNRSLGRDDVVVIRIGFEVATLTAGEWARLIANPKRASDAK